MRPILSILEGKWFAGSDVSVRELFVPLFTVWTKNPEQTYHYEQFTNGSAFRDGISYAFQNNRAGTIYIGAHGDQNNIYGFHDAGISRSVVRNAIKDQSTGTKRGVYFGACNFVNEKNALFILSSCPRVEWVAGYASTVDWTDSSALDLYFFRHFLFPKPGQGNPTPRTQLERASFAVKKIVFDMAPLAKRLALRVYVRKAGKGGMKELVKEALTSAKLTV